MGPNYLRHLFTHPEEHDNDRLLYSALPKSRDRIDIGTGWGIEVVEGYLTSKVWKASLGLLTLNLAASAIFWTLLQDLRSTVGVVASITASAGVLMMCS